jgi:hypothetical protein
MMEFTKEYYWVVICKNRLFHNFRGSAGHKILLGETDAFGSLPPLGPRFNVRCDDCGKEYAYRPAEVLRFETEPPESLVAHPLFSASERP